jgi:ABC-2 type transport system permease protein
VASGPLVRTGVVAAMAFRAAFAGRRIVALGLAAAIFPVLVLAIDAAAFSGLDLLGTSETLFSALFLPVILLLVALVLGVGAFRGELEEDTLVYPLSRTLPRPALAAGKYLGSVAATLFVLLPSAIVAMTLATVLGSGPTQSSTGLTEAVLLLTTIGSVAYVAIFLVLGLLTRQALVIGLLYGFIWETFISLIAGPVRELTVVYFLRGVGAGLVPGGSLGSGVGAMAPGGVAAGGVLLGAAAVVVASLWLSYAEIRPAAAPA